LRSLVEKLRECHARLSLFGPTSIIN